MNCYIFSSVKWMLSLLTFYLDYDDWYIQAKVKINTVPWGTKCASNDYASFKEINFKK